MRSIRRKIPAGLRFHFARNALAYQIAGISLGLVVALGAVAVVVWYQMLQPQRDAAGTSPYARTGLLEFTDPDELSPLQQRQALNRILDNAIAAHGGHFFVDRLLTVQKTGILTQNDRALHLHYAFKRPDRVRYRLEYDDRGSRFGYDGARAWRQTFAGGRLGPAHPLDEDDASGLVLTSELAVPAVLFFEEAQYMSIAGIEEVEGYPCFVVDYTGPLRASQRFYIDRESYVLRQRTRQARLRGEDSTVVEVVFSDFRSIDGIDFPFREKVLFDGEVQTVFEIEEYVINPGILDEFFEMPGES
ncbi:MAG: hypothetical protein JJU00_13725 [Opitutales bacterium]|nr:hypothetical protein [Opitutales bacterium]